MSRINICKHCGIKFERKHNPNRNYSFCSKKCSGLNTNTDGLKKGHGWNKGIKTGIVSSSCFSKGNIPYNKNKRTAHFCKNCGSKIKDVYNQNKYCSDECFKVGTSKENHYNWLGGITAETRRIRNHSEYLKWAKDIKKRDEYQCQICGEVGGALNSHHIKPFSKYPELRFDINNGITLCKECHSKWTLKQEEQWESYFKFNLETRFMDKEGLCLNG